MKKIRIKSQSAFLVGPGNPRYVRGCPKCLKQRRIWACANPERPDSDYPPVECRRCDYLNEHFAKYMKPRAA